MMDYRNMIDHTILKADATEADVLKLINEAKEHGFWSVCINPVWIPFAKKEIADSEVKICTVIGFPLGANAPEVKAFEAAQAVKAGADEVDMVINIGAVKSGQFDVVSKDIQGVVEAVNKDALVKLILETALLTKEEIVKACEIAVALGVEYVKTSTGFSTEGATVENVKLMKETVGDAALVKASGGIRSQEIAEAIIEAGASRLGVSNSVNIIGHLISK